MNQYGIQDLQRVKRLCRITAVVGTYHYAFSQAIECTAPTVSPNVNCGLGAMMYHCRFISYNK